MSMKIECIDDKMIIYLYKDKLCLDDINILNKQVKSLFIKLIKKYHYDFFGFSKVNIYHNDLYGSVLEIEKIYNNEFNIDIIDLKLVIYNNVPFYIEISDNLYLDVKEDFIKDFKYYININKLDNLLKYLEYGKIAYKNV